MTARPVGVVGASGRAAAMSLARAGMAPWAVDLFADRDLARIAPCRRCPFDDWPDAVPDLCGRLPPGPIVYTGGLENAPDVVGELARHRPVWGNGPGVLEQARNPFFLHHVLTSHDFSAPTVLTADVPPPANGRWLLKPRRGAGGVGVRECRSTEPPHSAEAFYLQEWIDGPPMSALFLSSDRVAALLGVTEQLIAKPWLHAWGYRYCGNIGPVPVAPAVAAALSRMGSVLTTITGLRGLWGVDFILHGDTPFLVEVNPRYTSAVEVLELASEAALMRDHAAAFSHIASDDYWRSSTGRLPPPERPSPRVVGKGVYFAPHPVRFPDSGPWDEDLSAPFAPWRVPGFADLSAPGEEVAAKSPLLTLFAAASSPNECRERLQSQAAQLDRLFARETP